MLIRSTWTLCTQTKIALPKTYGLALSKHLHEQLNLPLGSEVIPSTTFSGLIGPVTTSQDFVTFEAGEFYQLTLTGLQESGAKAIAALDLGDRLDFLGATFQVTDRTDDIASYETLYHTHVAGEPEHIRQFELSFLTPTAFNQNRLHLPLPVPTLMFRSWLERWNTFAPVYLGSDDLIGYLSESAALTRHRIQTRTVPIHQSYIPGFTGNITLKVLSRADPLLANVAALLVQYAEFAGTGVKTRLGMGMTNYGCSENSSLEI
jgi:CRISPR-associated endoribonuclease Cas6